MSLVGVLKSASRVRTKRAIHEKARKATVAFCIVIKDEGIQIIGSGALVHSGGVVVTAAHVMRALAEEIQELRDNGKKCQGRIMVTRGSSVEYDGGQQALRAKSEITLALVQGYSHHATTDLAVVKTDLEGHSEGVPGILPVNHDRVVRRGTVVAACGYPYGVGFHEGKSLSSSSLMGHISAVVPVPNIEPDLVRQYLLQMPVNPGNSGGPIFSCRTGEIHAVVSRRFEPGGIPAGLCVAVPAHGIHDVVEDAARGRF